MIKFHGRRRNPRLLFNFDEPELHVVYEAGFFPNESRSFNKWNQTKRKFLNVQGFMQF